MYHDKRFQLDTYFPMIAFNHEQLKAAATGSMLAKRSKFDAIARRLSAVNPKVAGDIAGRMAAGDHVEPSNPAEQICFDLIKDLDGVAGRVKGSVTSKKYMRNEIWSLINFLGAPSWYITLSPADIQHPICIYYAGTQTEFRPTITPYDAQMRSVCENPVDGARFFHFMVEIFITDVLGSIQAIAGFMETQVGTMAQWNNKGT